MESNEVSESLNYSKGGPQTHKFYDNQAGNPKSESTKPSTLHKCSSQNVIPSHTVAEHRRAKLPINSATKKPATQFIDLITPPTSTSTNPRPPVLFLPNVTEENLATNLPESDPRPNSASNPEPNLEFNQETPNLDQIIPFVEDVERKDDVEVEADVEDEDDVDLTDLDYEDKNDDDLFNEYVDHDIQERVTRSLGGLFKDATLEDHEDENEGGVYIGNEEDIVDSDGEVVSEVDSDDDGPVYPEFNPDTNFKGKVVLSKGLKFPSNKVFRRALQYHAIDHGYDCYFLHNNNIRVSAYCAHRCGCPWKRARILECKKGCRRKCRFRIHCRKLKGEATWQIKSLRLKHICGHQVKNSKIISQYLAEKYLDDWRDDPHWKLGAFIKRARRECRVEIEYYLAWYDRERAFKMIFGDASLEYEKVWDYAAAILKYNPGSTAVVKVVGVENAQPVFQRMYVCLQACKEGFLAGCRPILGVDGAHLKGAYPGILLTAVGKDGNNNIFPVAWAVVEVENSESWTWFLELLRAYIASVADSITWVHEADELTYMSDRQKGLLDAFATVISAADTRYCCRHIWSNFKNKFPGTLYKEHFWKAARSTTEHHFKQHMEEIKKLSVDAFNYLQGIPPSHWSRHKFSTSSKSGMLLNNCYESFNNVLREARTKPILKLMEWVRRYVMGRFFAKNKGLKAFNGIIMPTVLKMVHRGLQQVSNMRVSQADLMEFEVDDSEDTYVVNLENKACSCNRWTLMGIPCWHALACIQMRRLDIEPFIHPAYHVATYTKAYAPSFKAMSGHQQWEVTPYPRPLPPAHRKLPGRPSQKKRKKEAGEDKERKNVKRSKVQNKCSNCGGLGHYKNKCPTPPIEKIKRPPGRPKKNVATGEAQTGPTAAGQAAGATSQLLSQAAQASQQSISLSAPQH